MRVQDRQVHSACCSTNQPLLTTPSRHPAVVLTNHYSPPLPPPCLLQSFSGSSLTSGSPTGSLTAGAEFGRALLFVPKWNGQSGNDYLVVGAPGASGGSLYFFNIAHANGEPSLTLVSSLVASEVCGTGTGTGGSCEAEGTRFGYSLALVATSTSDGHTVIAVGAPDGGVGGSGEVWLLKFKVRGGVNAWARGRVNQAWARGCKLRHFVFDHSTPGPFLPLDAPLYRSSLVRTALGSSPRPRWTPQASL